MFSQWKGKLQTSFDNLAPRSPPTPKSPSSPKSPKEKQRQTRTYPRQGSTASQPAISVSPRIAAPERAQRSLDFTGAQEDAPIAIIGWAARQQQPAQSEERGQDPHRLSLPMSPTQEEQPEPVNGLGIKTVAHEPEEAQQAAPAPAQAPTPTPAAQAKDDGAATRSARQRERSASQPTLLRSAVIKSSKSGAHAPSASQGDNTQVTFPSTLTIGGSSSQQSQPASPTSPNYKRTSSVGSAARPSPVLASPPPLPLPPADAASGFRLRRQSSPRVGKKLTSAASSPDLKAQTDRSASADAASRDWQTLGQAGEAVALSQAESGLLPTEINGLGHAEQGSLARPAIPSSAPPDQTAFPTTPEGPSHAKYSSGASNKSTGWMSGDWNGFATIIRKMDFAGTDADADNQGNGVTPSDSGTSISTAMTSTSGGSGSRIDINKEFDDHSAADPVPVAAFPTDAKGSTSTLVVPVDRSDAASQSGSSDRTTTATSELRETPKPGDRASDGGSLNALTVSAAASDESLAETEAEDGHLEEDEMEEEVQLMTATKAKVGVARAAPMSPRPSTADTINGTRSPGGSDLLSSPSPAFGSQLATSSSMSSFRTAPASPSGTISSSFASPSITPSLSPSLASSPPMSNGKSKQRKGPPAALTLGTTNSSPGFPRNNPLSPTSPTRARALTLGLASPARAAPPTDPPTEPLPPLPNTPKSPRSPAVMMSPTPRQSHFHSGMEQANSAPSAPGPDHLANAPSAMAPLSVVVQPNTPPGQAPLNNPPVSHAPAAVIAPPLAGNSPRNSAERSSTADFGDVRAAPRAQAAPLQRAIGSSASSSEHTSGSRSHVATSSVDSSVGASSAIGRSSGSGSGSDRSSKDSLEAIGHEAIVRTLTRVPSNAGLRKAAEVTKATPVTVSPKQFASPGQTGATPSIVGRARASLESAASTGASASSGPMPRSGSISSVAPSQNQRWSNGSESSLMSSQSVQPGPAAARLRSGSSTNAPSAASRAALLAQQTSPNLGGPTSASGHGSFPQRPGLKTSVSASGAVSGTFTTAADGHAGGPGDSPVRTMSEAGHGFSGSLQGHGKRRTESAGNGYISASASTSGHGYGYGNGYGYGSSLGRRASVSSLSSRRTEMEEDRVLHGVSPSLRLDRLRRTETRFTGAFGEIAQAFKQLQAEKRTLEKIVRATTPLDGIGDGEGLGKYLENVANKLDLNAAEIRKLLDLLDQQRMVMDEMIDTHRLETDHNLNEIDELHAALEHHVRESETHRTAAIKMFEELEAARTEMVAAKAETVKVRASAKEEEEKREKAISLLRAVRGKLQNVEKAKLEADEARDSARSVVKTTQEMLEAEKARFETELGGVKRAHEEHHASLLVAHARELDTLREAHVKEFGSHKSAFENELANAKTAHQGEIDSLTSRASQLERSLQDLTQEKLTLSDAHSVLQTELEAGRAQLVQVTEQMTKHVGEVSSLQKRCAELEKQLTDHTERATAQEQASQKSLVDATTGHETKQRELLDRIAELEKAQEAARESVERDLRERDEELKRLQLVLEEKEGEREKLDKASRDSIERAEVAEKETEMLKAKLAELEANLSTPRPDSEAQTEMTKAAVPGTDERYTTLLTEHESLKEQLGEQRTREAQIRTAYKQLREELRKVQAGLQTERKRNSGISFLSGGAAGLASPSLIGSPASTQGGFDFSPVAAAAMSSSGLGPGVGAGGSVEARALKRLSLPTAGKPPSPMLTGSFESRPASAASANFPHPPSAYRRMTSSAIDPYWASMSPMDVHTPSTTEEMESLRDSRRSSLEGNANGAGSGPGSSHSGPRRSAEGI